ncbi:MAG: lactate racemase domain-containing protein [bacterium]
MKINLFYGSSKISVNIPSKNLEKIIVPRKTQKTSSSVLKEAFENPYGKKLEILAQNKKVVVLIEDCTRSNPHKKIISECNKRLKKAQSVVYIIATGCHSPLMPENQKIVNVIKESIEKYKIKNAEIIIHDSQKANFKYLGKTSFKTPVFVNEKALNTDLYVITSSMKSHYFAGYCNPIKNFAPGVCKFETVEANHFLSLEKNATFGQHPYHPNPKKRNNPVAEDMLETMNLIKQKTDVFALVIYGSKKIEWAKAGEIKKVIRDGIKKVDELTSFFVKPAQYIIVSPGGYPNDADVYMAQRGLDLVNQAVLDNGEILFLAECKNGFAPSKEAEDFFYKRLTWPLAKIFKEIKTNYKLSMQKTYKMAKLIERTKKIWLYSQLKNKDVLKMHLYPTPSPQEIIDKWIKKDPTAKILVFNSASNLAIYKK